MRNRLASTAEKREKPHPKSLMRTTALLCTLQQTSATQGSPQSYRTL